MTLSSAAPGGDLTGDQRRALDMLAGSPAGCTEGTWRGRGFTLATLGRLVRAGLAVAKPESVKAGSRTLALVRVEITDAGRRALAM